MIKQKNNLKFKIISLFTFCLFAYLLIFVFAPRVSAQEFSAGINPVVIQIDSEPPANIKAPIALENPSDQTITYAVFLRPFKPGSEKNGEPSYDADISQTYKDLFTNVHLTEDNREITTITLSPKQKKELTLNINLAKGYEPSDYYFTVVFLSQPETGTNPNSSVGARGGIGTNVLLTVGLKSEPKGRIAEFSVPKFVTHGPLSFILELANDNNYYVSPTGNVIIRNMFGQTIGNIEFGPTNILAYSTRLISNNGQPQEEGKIVWNEKFLLGIYKADVVVAISDKGPLLKQSRYFFAFPLELVLGLIVFIVLLLALIRRVREKTLEEN